VGGKLLPCVIKTNPSGRQVIFNGVTTATPKTIYSVTDYWVEGDDNPDSLSFEVSVPSPQTASSGTTRYLYSSWSDGGDQTHTIIPPSSEQTFTVSFTTQYALTTSSNIPETGLVTATPDPQETKWYSNGEVVTLSATAPPGYSFLRWSPGSRSNSLSVTMNKPQSIKAVFRKDKYKIKVNINPSKGGKVKKTPNKSTYGYGEVVTLTPTPKDGYIFTGWSGDVNDTSNPLTITMDSAKSLVANFSEDTTSQFSLVGALESPSDGISVSGVQAIYGWALDEDAISQTELFIDGVYAGRIPHGGLRQDIGELFPGHPNARHSGFAWNLDYSKLAPGEHSIQVKVHSGSGKVLDFDSSVFVKKFHGQEVEGIVPGAAWLSDIDITADRLTKTYDLRLEWSAAFQAFRISDIEEKAGLFGTQTHPQSALSISPAPGAAGTPGQVSPECALADSTVSSLPLMGCLENPRNKDKVSGIQTIHGWALDEKAISRIKLFVDGVYVSDIPRGGTREDLRQDYPDYPGAVDGGFSMIMNYSTLSPGSHTIELRIHNQNNETLELSTNVFVEKFQGDFVTQVTPRNGWLRDVAVTSEGVTKMYDVNLQWSDESQSFEITEIVQKSD